MSNEYKEFLDKLHTDILNRAIDREYKLPSERDLQKMYDVTRYTLRKGIDELVEKGLVYRVQGSGIYLRKQPNEKMFSLDNTLGITLESVKLNRTLETKVIRFEEVDFQSINMNFVSLSLPGDTRLYFVERLRIIDQKPFVVEYSYYIKDKVKYLNKEIVDGSIFAYLNEVVGLRFGFADKRVSAEKLSSETADLLNLNKDDPTIVIKDQAYLANGELFNFSKLCYNYEEAQFFMHASMR